MSPIDWAERGWLPDFAIRWGIRRLLAERLRSIAAGGQAERERRKQDLIDQMARSPVAIQTAAANQQHYELPAPFFEKVLGPRLKYSSCVWDEGVESLADAEERMLELSSEHARLRDGQTILELGCGWGSWSLWMAERFPSARITAVSNSNDQRQFIEARAADRGLKNLTVITADMTDFDAEHRAFDRVVSIEMFEHMRNYATLLERISSWLRPDGSLFLHIFRHRSDPYFYETDGDNDWMARYFFSGGLMPSEDLLSRFNGHMEVAESWNVNGGHYRDTLEAWLGKLDRNREEVLAILVPFYGEREARLWLQRWRIFFLACSELFGYGDGKVWTVGHYRMTPR